MAPKYKEGNTLLVLPGATIAWAHSIAAYSAFLGAFIVGVWLHYHKIVENQYYDYPVEWFPSVSATIGDRYPERSVFQVFIAITSGPRFLLVGLWYVLTARPNSKLPKIIAGVGIFRTLSCGGWTYVTSTDDHHWHDIFMISYLVATIPWTLGCLALSPPNPKAIRYRKIFAGAFFGTLVPLTYYFLQHKVHKVPGAYSIYALFEWSVVLYDVGFDAVTLLDFKSMEIVVRDVKGLSRGDEKRVVDAELEKRKGEDVGMVFGRGFSWGESLDALADVYNGFVFWTVLTSLGLVLWYFPLWYMGLSGYEVAVMASISPFFLGIGPLRGLVVRNLRIAHLLGISGLLAFLVPRPDLRLLVVTFSVWMSCTAWAATFHSERSQPHRLEAKISAFGIGLIASSVAKYFMWTNNPVWPTMHAENGGWNKIGLLVGVLAVLRSTRRAPPSGSEALASDFKRGFGALAALGLGGLLFGMHSLLSDSSTMISWVWEGHPVRGPLAVPHGTWTHLAMGAGMLFGLFYPGLSRSWTAFGIGAIGAAVLTTTSHWLGFYGGLVLAAYLMAITPMLISSAARHGPGNTFGVSFLVYNFLVLFHVWTTAYAFVPGGPLVREHTDWVMLTMMIFIAAGVFSAISSTPATASRKPGNPAARRQRSYYIYALGLLQLLSISIAYVRFPSYDYTPYHSDANVITAGIWTIHFGIDNPMWDSTRRMRDLIRDAELDIVGLLESDTQHIIMGNRDTTQYLAEDLGMHVDFGPGPNKHTWGVALLSKFPILNSTHHLLPSPVGELAPAIHATVDAYGTLVDVFVFHSGQEEDPEDRRLQSLYLADLMASSPRPSILLSYLVTKPGEGNYNTYVGAQSTMRDIDPTDWDRWCEYILFKNIRRSGYARVSRSTITDTELQVGKFVVGQPENGADERVAEESVPVGERFPQVFRGEGVRGHQYHVFDEPRYFA